MGLGWCCGHYLFGLYLGLGRPSDPLSPMGKAASVGGLFHSYQIVTTYSVSICSFSLRTAAIAVCVFRTAPRPSVARKSLISLSSLPGSPLLSNILTFILSLRSICGGLFI